MFGLTVQREVHHGEEGTEEQKDEAAGCTIPISKQIDMCLRSPYSYQSKTAVCGVILTTITVSILITASLIYITGMSRDASSRWA